MSNHNQNQSSDGEVVYTKIRGGLARVGKEGTAQDLNDFYNGNSNEFNEMLDFAQYKENGGQSIAEVVAKLQPNKDARILECAAGTGYAGEQLRKLGYNNVDALDPCEEMLNLAKSQNIYKNYIVDRIYPDKSNSVEDATYDTIFIAGSVIKGHITLDCLPQVTRMLRKGGTLTFNIGDLYLKTDPDFDSNTLRKQFQASVDEGKWTKWEVTRKPYLKNEWCDIYSITL